MRIRYYGHMGAPTGYGIAANETCMALLAAGAELEISTPEPIQDWRCVPEALLEIARNQREFVAHPDAIIVHTLPLSCAPMLRAIEDQRGPNTRVVAYTTWEGSSPIPAEMTDALRGYDQVWVPSKQNWACFRNGGLDKIRTIPHAFDEPRFELEADTHGFLGAVNWTPDSDLPFRFYYVGAFTHRKNVAGLVRAFCRAFGGSPERDRVQLLIHSAGAGDDALKMALIETGMPSHLVPNIVMANRWLEPGELAGMHRHFQCFVTASRGEAWNLPAFDAMLAGRHVIAPFGQGSEEFLGDTTASRYKARTAMAHGELRFRPLPDGDQRQMAVQYLGAQGLDVRSDWQEPDLHELAIYLRRTYTSATSRAAIDYDPRERFGRNAVGALAIKTLETMPQKETP